MGVVRPQPHHVDRPRSDRPRPDRPILITEAPVNADDEYNLRRKKYLIMMIIRALCIIGAATTFTFSGWLAAAFVAAALVLPWSAVLIANNRPPKQAVRFRRFLPGALGDRELTAGPAERSSRIGADPERDEPAEPAAHRIIDL
jgi:Flp pilus assembly protein TadB